jgi:hypothetical protein
VTPTHATAVESARLENRNLIPRGICNTLINPTTVQVSGQWIDGRCVYELTLTLPPGAAAIQQNELSEDETNCEMTLEQGTPADPNEPAMSGTLQTESQTHSDTCPPSPTPPFGCGGSTHSAGWHKSWWEDPVGLDVNSVTSFLDWNWITNDSVWGASCVNEFRYYAPTWWEMVSHNAQCEYTPNHMQIESSGYAHYHNGRFCFGGDTQVFYNRNRIIGFHDGSLLAIIVASKQGACADLLEFHNRAVRTLN